MTTLSESYFRDQWILEQLENGSLELDFSIDEDGNLSSTGRIKNPTMVQLKHERTNVLFRCNTQSQGGSLQRDGCQRTA